MCDLSHWDLAANRYYYSCYHLVQGLLISEGLSAHTHAGLLRVFSNAFVRTNRVPLEYGGFLSRLVQLREKADYNCSFVVTKEEIEALGPLVDDFVETISAIIQIP